MTPQHGRQTQARAIEHWTNTKSRVLLTKLSIVYRYVHMSSSSTSVTKFTGRLADSVLLVNFPSEDYHRDIAAQSCSLLKPILTSPAHYKASFFANREPTKAMDFGTLIHTLVLEPATFPTNYAVYTGTGGRKNSEYKDFVKANTSRQVLDASEFQVAQILADKILNRSVLGRPFGDYVQEGIPEATIYYTDPSTDTRCRVRIDLLHPEIRFDLKTTSYIDRRAWVRHALDLDYDLQAYMYSLACSLFYGETTPKPFIFVTAESAAPHSVSAFTAGNSFIEEGSKKYREALVTFAACSSTDHWPDAGSEEIVEIEHWQQRPSSPAWRANLPRT